MAISDIHFVFMLTKLLLRKSLYFGSICSISRAYNSWIIIIFTFKYSCRAKSNWFFLKWLFAFFSISNAFFTSCLIKSSLSETSFWLFEFFVLYSINSEPSVSIPPAVKSLYSCTVVEWLTEGELTEISDFFSLGLIGSNDGL